MEEHNLQVFYNKVLRKMFETKRDDVGKLGHYIQRCLVICTIHLVLLQLRNQGD